MKTGTYIKIYDCTDKSVALYKTIAPTKNGDNLELVKTLKKPKNSIYNGEWDLSCHSNFFRGNSYRFSVTVLTKKEAFVELI